VAGTKQASAMPDLPTVSEAGVPGFQSGSWQGLLAPAGTPGDIVAKLHDAVVKVLNDPDMTKHLADQGAEVVGSTPEEFATFIRDDTRKWAEIVKETGIKVQ
jgi:tripartite-type tricarboxylate transporter receptor subunit TctC